MTPSSAQTHHANTPPRRIPFNLSPVAALVAGLGLLGAGLAHGADAPGTPADAASAAAAAEQPDTQQLGAVTVRSRNRIEKLQDVPISISVVQGSELAALSATGIEEVVKRAGNVSWNLGNQRTSSLSIRGIGKVGQTEAQDPSVGIIVDGVSYAYNALTSSFDYIDVDTIEVTRGPQGTLLGKNTSVGNIIINTRRPSFTPSADYGLSFRERDGVQAWAALGGPIRDDLLAWRGTFSVNRGEGDLRNTYNRDITYTNKDRVSGRVQFLLTPSPDFNAIARFEVQPRASETTNGRSFSFPNRYTYLDGSAVPASSTSTEARLARRWFAQLGSYNLLQNQTTINDDNQRGLVTGSRGASAELNWKLGDHTVTSITAYKDYHFNAVNDEGTPFDVQRNSGGYWNDYRQVSQELRLTSPVGGFVDYQGGLYYLKVTNSATYNRIWGNDAGAWFASASQYTTLDRDAAGRYLMANSLANLKTGVRDTTGVQAIDNKSGAVFAQANWHLSEPLTFTTGLRITREKRENVGANVILDNGNAPELNPAAVNGVNTGGFNSAATATTLNGVSYAPGDLLAGNSAAQVALADATANKYFGVANYAALTAAQKQQIAAAKAVRLSQLGVLYNPVAAQPYVATQPTLLLSPSYKFSPDVTGYLSFQHGEKAGIAQLFNGVSYQVKPEKTDSFELGAKTLLLDRTLVLNTAAFLTNIRNYQQATRIIDEYNTELNRQNGVVPSGAYAGITGNVPKVQVKGLEVDGTYAGIRNTRLRFAGSYNHAVFKQFPNAAYPAEEGNVVTATNAYKDISGRTLPGAPKLSFNVGVDYRKPVLDDLEFHATGNVAYSGSYLSDNSLSIYSRIPSTYKVDAAIGLGKANKTFDISLLAKNLFNDKTPQSQTWTSVSPAVPRSFGIQILGKL